MAQERPIDIGAVIQRGFAVIGRNAAQFALLALLLSGLPAFIVQYSAVGRLEWNGAVELVVFALLAIFNMLSIYLLQAAIVRATILDLSGRRPDLPGSLRASFRFLLPMIGLSIITGLGVALGLLLLIVPGVMLYCAWIVAVPVLVEENAGVFGSLGRSADLTRGSRWRIFALILVYLVFWGLVTALFSALGGADPIGQPLKFALFSAGGATVSGLLLGAMLASLYFELRTAREGASTDSLAEVFA